ncbi:MAG TPA: hypothetical protein PLC54_02060 [Spirochaetales bacterium]|nr:hypothetical protein [Spirochaetales bacterium]
MLFLQADGKILVGGESSDESYNNRSVLLRLNTDGSLDTSFGTNGMCIETYGGSQEGIDDVVIGNGRIYAAGLGRPDPEGDYIYTISAYTMAGAKDTTFGTDGLSSVDPVQGDSALGGIAIAPDSSIIITGRVGETKFGVARLSAAGVLDTTFGTSGLLLIDPSTSYDDIGAMAIQPDGKIVIAGYGTDEMVYRYLALRLNSDGSIDTGFGTNGYIFHDPPADSESYANGMLIQNDGKLLLVGHIADSTTTKILMSRYWP